MSDLLLNAASPALIVELLHAAGCRAEIVPEGDGARVQSALQGIGFTVNFGNPQPSADGGEPRYADCAFRCVLAVNGDIPTDLADRWNRERRFARLARQGNALVLNLDLLLAGGVSRDWLRGQIELWDLVLRDYLRFLQTPAAEAA